MYQIVGGRLEKCTEYRACPKIKVDEKMEQIAKLENILGRTEAFRSQHSLTLHFLSTYNDLGHTNDEIEQVTFGAIQARRKISAMFGDFSSPKWTLSLSQHVMLAACRRVYSAAGDTSVEVALSTTMRMLSVSVKWVLRESKEQDNKSSA
eukprot:gb/GEZJ01004551.1/.p1 GENE.gb/GEZJ01004551.1/~~gb/GEZJ01004551.1/.p1  ORF type:complete len:150 (+),score=14.51 gb/GEZJ01004551.1/:870-1319(+)